MKRLNEPRFDGSPEAWNRRFQGRRGEWEALKARWEPFKLRAREIRGIQDLLCESYHVRECHETMLEDAVASRRSRYAGI